jgi:adenylosuccinate lyase
MQHQALDVVNGMRVYPERMRENLDVTRGALFSQAVLSALVAAGLGRDEAYRIVQRNAQRAWSERRSFRALLEEEPEVAKRIDSAALGELFDYRRFIRHLPVLFERLDEVEAD